MLSAEGRQVLLADRDRLYIWCLRQRQPQREASARRVLIFQYQLTPHTLCQLAPDRQSEPETCLPHGPAATHEALEDQLTLVGGYARTFVADAERRPVAVAQLDGDLAARGTEPERIVEQDPHDPGDAPGICQRPHRPALVVEHGRDPPLGAAGVELREHRSAQLSQLDRL